MATKASSKARSPKKKTSDVGLDHSWAKTRSQNIEDMWRRVRSDADYAITLAIDEINRRSEDMRSIGDNSYSIMLSAVSTSLSNLRSRRKPRRR